MKHNRYWGSEPRPQSKAEFFNAVAAERTDGGGTVATIRMYGPIDSWGGWWGISTKDIGKVLDALPDTVDQIILRINSPGGEVSEGMAILNMLRAHKARVTAVVDGRACSAASFIAAGCDESVMSPGTLQMIHSPWGFAIGNARDMQKAASVLDIHEASLIEVYTAKAGEKDWPALLADETWLTGPQAVELGLADRVAVIPDAGEAETAGSEPVIITVDPDEDDDFDDIDDAAAPLIAARVAASLKLPDSTEPGDPNRKENAVAYSDLTAGLRERLGVSDATATDETLLAALDEVLAEQAESTTTPASAALPEGTVAIDATVLADLQAGARAGAEARAAQDKSRRDSIIDTALREGRITSASHSHFRAMLDADEAGATALIASLATNTVNTTEIGKADALTSSDDALYAAAWGDDNAKEA